MKLGKMRLIAAAATIGGALCTIVTMFTGDEKTREIVNEELDKRNEAEEVEEETEEEE